MNPYTKGVQHWVHLPFRSAPGSPSIKACHYPVCQTFVKIIFSHLRHLLHIERIRHKCLISVGPTSGTRTYLKNGPPNLPHMQTFSSFIPFIWMGLRNPCTYAGTIPFRCMELLFSFCIKSAECEYTVFCLFFSPNNKPVCLLFNVKISGYV